MTLKVFSSHPDPTSSGNQGVVVWLGRSGRLRSCEFFDLLKQITTDLYSFLLFMNIFNVNFLEVRLNTSYMNRFSSFEALNDLFIYNHSAYLVTS